MTDNEINQAIADELQCEIDDGKVYIVIDGDICGFDLFTEDLNACRIFEGTLDGNPSIYNQQDLYIRELSRIVKQGLAECWTIATATARQKCEAYLKIIKKWKK